MAKRRVPVGGGEGRILRPETKVLSDAALVPAQNLVKPAPTQFTHEVQRRQPYYYSDDRERPDGEFAVGVRVVLMSHDGGKYCRVVDEQGLYVSTEYQGLRSL
jgi:hypothetical protein